MVVCIDGGARGNPGPAAIGVALFRAGDEAATPTAAEAATAAAEPVLQVGAYIGETTNNVAEYYALLRGLEEALALGATEIEVRSDSELLVKQMNGEYRVRNDGLRPLHGRARALSHRVPTSYVHVPRERNRLADSLVNKALDDWLKGRDGGGETPRTRPHQEPSA